MKNKKENHDPQEGSEDPIRIERNADTLPIWAPSRHATALKREYQLEWISPNARVVVQSAGEYGALRWQDKLILVAITRLWYEQGMNPDGWVNFTLSDISKRLEKEKGGKQYTLITASLWRLRGCLIQHFESFYDRALEAHVSKVEGHNILTYLRIREFKRQDQETEDFGQARLNLDLVRNLIGNYTRPVSIQFLMTLTERGGLFEAYVNSVLYAQPIVRKDVFDLWKQLGLSIKGIRYASELTKKMRADLNKMRADPFGLLGEYSFEKSETKPRSQNLVLIRRKNPYVDQHQRPPQTAQLSLNLNVSQLTPTEFDLQVEQIQFELGDTGDDFNIRRIVERIPDSFIKVAIHDAVGRKSDGMIKTSAVAYFIGRMKNVATEQGIDLGFK